MVDDEAPTRDAQPTALERPRRGAPVADDADTEIDPPARELPARPAPDIAGATLATMRAEEVANTRIIIRVGRALGIAALLPMPILGGSTALRVLFAILVAIAIAVGYVVDRRLRDPERYSEATILVLALAAGVGAYVGLLYWGIFSAAQLFPVLGLYFYARRVAFAPALGVYIASVIAQGIAGGLVITGVVDDPGVYSPSLPWPTLLLGHLLIQLGCLSAFLMGRSSHRASRAAIERMHKAMHLAAQREALLYEARQDLDRALRVGDPGRYTGQIVGGYELGAIIGHGGMGEVYEGTHVGDGSDAAVKLLPVRELADEHHLSRFLREMQLVSSLESRHVVRVLETSEPDDPIPFLVMERLRGANLAQILRAGPMSPERLDKLLAEVGAALDVAREAGIVHRDLKPHNLVLARDREVAATTADNRDVAGRGQPATTAADDDDRELWKVLDFGVATLSDSSGTLTRGRVVGTPLYMSPEQARGEPVDHRADLYALGAIAYRCLTGRPPFAGATGNALLFQVVNNMPARPSAIAGLPPAIDEVFERALAKDPADRYQRPAALREALAAALRR